MKATEAGDSAFGRDIRWCASVRPIVAALEQSADERTVELVARVLHREHEQAVTEGHRPWSAESDSYRESFRQLARLHIAAELDGDDDSGHRPAIEQLRDATDANERVGEDYGYFDDGAL